VRLAEYKKCVSSATQQERLKACYEKMTLWRAAEDAKRQEFQKEQKDPFFEDLAVMWHKDRISVSVKTETPISNFTETKKRKIQF